MFFAKVAHGQEEVLALMIVIPVIVCILAVMGICHMFARRKQRQQYQALLAATEAEYKRWRREVARAGRLQVVPAAVCLNDGESCYYKTSATLAEPRSVRDTSHLGGAVRVAKGITVLGGNSHSESHDEWRDLSSGTLYITNKRIIFDGEMHNRTVKLVSLISVVAEPRMIAVSTSSRQKTMLLTRLNGKIAQGVINILRNSIR